MSKTLMLDFASVFSYVETWTERRNVSLTQMTFTSKVDKDSPNSNTCVVNGVEFKLWVDGRPTNRKTLQQLCCADSCMDGFPISANQAKCALTRWFHEQTSSFGGGDDNLFAF